MASTQHPSNWANSALDLRWTGAVLEEGASLGAIRVWSELKESILVQGVECCSCAVQRVLRRNGVLRLAAALAGQLARCSGRTR